MIIPVSLRCLPCSHLPYVAHRLSCPWRKWNSYHFNKNKSNSFGETVHANTLFSLIILMDNKKHFQCWCNAVYCCHSHIIFQLRNAQSANIASDSAEEKTFHSTTHIQTFKETCFVINLCICLPVFLLIHLHEVVHFHYQQFQYSTLPNNVCF